MSLENALFPEIVQTFLFASGGSIIISGLIGLIVFAIIMNRLSVGLAPGVMISSFLIGVISTSVDSNIVQGVSNVFIFRSMMGLFIIATAIFFVNKLLK